MGGVKEVVANGGRLDSRRHHPAACQAHPRGGSHLYLHNLLPTRSCPDSEAKVCVVRGFMFCGARCVVQVTASACGHQMSLSKDSVDEGVASSRGQSTCSP